MSRFDEHNLKNAKGMLSTLQEWLESEEGKSSHSLVRLLVTNEIERLEDIIYKVSE